MSGKGEQMPFDSSTVAAMRQLLLNEKGDAARTVREAWLHGPSGATYEEFKKILKMRKKKKIQEPEQYNDTEGGGTGQGSESAGEARLLAIGGAAEQDALKAGSKLLKLIAQRAESQESLYSANEAVIGNEGAASRGEVGQESGQAAVEGEALKVEREGLSDRRKGEAEERSEETRGASRERNTAETTPALAHDEASTSQRKDQADERRGEGRVSSRGHEATQKAGASQHSKAGEPSLQQEERDGNAQERIELEEGRKPGQENASTDPAPGLDSEQDNEPPKEPSKESPPAPPPSLPVPPPLPKGFTSPLVSTAPSAAKRIDPRGVWERRGELHLETAERPREAQRGSQGAEAGEREAVHPLVRMVAVFEDCTSPVTRVKFSRHRPELFAYATSDGSFRVCHVGQCSGPRDLLSLPLPAGGTPTKGRGSLGPKSPLKKAGAGGGRGSPRTSGGGSASSSPSSSSSMKRGSSPLTQGPVKGKGSPKPSPGSTKGSPGPALGSPLPPRPSPTQRGTGTESPAGPPSKAGVAKSDGRTALGGAPSSPEKQVEPPRVMHELVGHTKEVSDFDWASDDEYICSASLDRSLRVWEVSSGKCLRIIYTELHQIGIRFHPMNSNFLLAANAKPELTVVNFSTGRVVSRYALAKRVSALEADRTNIFFVGDAEGCTHSFTVDPFTGAIAHHHSNRVGVQHAAPTASLHFHPSSKLAGTPVLLACGQDGSVRFYSVALELQGYLFLKCSLQKTARAPNLCASFSPCLASAGAIKAGTGEFIVTGNADFQVCFFDFFQPKRLFAGRALGHKAFVMDVSFNLTGEWLATGDATGVLILWTPVAAGEMA